MEFFGRFRIADFATVEIHDTDAAAVFYFAFTELVQVRLPTWIVFKVFSDVFREKNMSGITAIHHPLGNVDSSPGDIGLLVQISDFIDRAAVNSHAHPEFRMPFELLANFQCAQNRRFQSVTKNERATVAGG